MKSISRNTIHPEIFFKSEFKQQFDFMDEKPCRHQLNT